MKKWIISLAVLSLVSLSIVSPAVAGEKSRHRWQGIAIGAASFVVLNHLAGHRVPIEQTTYTPAPPPRSYGYYDDRYGYRPRYERPGRHQGRYKRHWAAEGHWESVWIPGHHDSCGKYVDGHYERYYVKARRY